MKFGKRLLVCLLVLAMVGTAAFCVSAASRGTCGAGLTWTLDARGTLTIRGSGNMPANGTPTDGGASFRSNASRVKTIKVENGAANIGKGAFASFTALTQVTLANSVKKIEANAFSGCTALTTVDLGRGVSRIEEHAFRGCTALKTISLPESVSDIGMGVFDDCTSLGMVEIANQNCRFPSSDFMPASTIISGYEGSTASAYAEKYGHKFVLIGTPYEEPTTEPTKPTTDPTTPTQPQNQTGEVCPLCGQQHDALLGFLHKVIYFFTKIFSFTSLI